MNETTSSVKTTPKDFFLTLGALIALYISIVSFLGLVFGLIDHYLPDAISYDDILGTIRWTVSSLIILFPLFVYISSLINKEILITPKKKDLWIKKWSTYLTLFLTGATVSIDLIVLIYTFLGGEITLRFILKVVAILVTALFVFSYYFYELKNTPKTKDEKVRLYTILASVFVLMSIIGGFISVGSPLDERSKRFDDQRVADLTSIQDQIMNYWQKKGILPTKLTDLNDPLASFTVPVDPVNSDAYIYQETGQNSFMLCAIFAFPSRDVRMGGVFTHNKGKVCFSRTIDPQLYPAMNK